MMGKPVPEQRGVTTIQNGAKYFVSMTQRVARVIGLCGVVVWLASCDREGGNLEAEANGYLCRACKSKFYVEREVFADFCSNCKSSGIDQVVTFVCSKDSYTTVGPRGAARCAKCGQETNGFSIPRAIELQEWGAAKKNRKEVCGT